MSAHSTKLDMSSLARLVPVAEVNVGGALVPTCNAREMHCYLEVKRDFSNWIKARIAKYGFQEAADYVTEVYAQNGGNQPTQTKGGRPAIEYHLTLDMAKELAMVENNPMGRQVRRYFIECERQSQAGRHTSINIPPPSDPAWAAWLSLSTDERRTRQRDVLIFKQMYGQVGMRLSAVQVGMPHMPDWALGRQEQYEMELAQQSGLTVTVNVPGGMRT